MVAEFHRCGVSLEAIKATLKPRSEGYSALQLVTCARSLGLQATGLATNEAALPTLQLPCILHWKERHFVVLAGFDGGTYLVLDPATAGPARIQRESMEASYSGTAIIVSKCHQRDSVAPTRA